MINLKKIAMVCFLLLIGFSSCGEKPLVQIKAALPVTGKSKDDAGPPLQMEAMASISDMDWQQVQALFQILLPRILAMESAILMLPQGTAILIEEARAQLQLSGMLLQVSGEMLVKTESLLQEAQKTRKSLEKLMAPRD